MTPQTPETFSALNGSLMKMMEWNRGRVEELIRKTREEQLRFVNRRLEQNAKTLESMRNCQGLSGLWSVEQDWFVNAARDYAQGTEKLGGIIWDMAERGIKESTDEAHASSVAIQSAVRSDAQKAREAKERHAAE
jgi:hypothetical protein